MTRSVAASLILLLSFPLLSSCSPSTSPSPSPSTSTSPSTSKPIPTDKPHAALQKSISPEQMQEAMIKVSQIGEKHRKLDPLIGTYKTEAKFWMKPGDAPEVSHGTAEFKWILNGHFIKQEYWSSFHGQPYLGEGVLGYSNMNERYESTWADSMGTEVIKSQGTSNADGSVITLLGKFECPLLSGPMHTREVLTITKDRHVVEAFHQAFDGSGEYKAMEITYERTKPAGKPSVRKSKKR